MKQSQIFLWPLRIDAPSKWNIFPTKKHILLYECNITMKIRKLSLSVTVTFIHRPDSSFISYHNNVLYSKVIHFQIRCYNLVSSLFSLLFSKQFLDFSFFFLILLKMILPIIEWSMIWVFLMVNTGQMSLARLS